MLHGSTENSMPVKRLVAYTHLSSTVSEQVIGRKLRYFHTPPCLAAPQGVTPSEFREDLDTYKTRMNGLSCGEESMAICSAVLIQYQRVTDGQMDGWTDGQTDVEPIAKTHVKTVKFTTVTNS